LVHFNWGLDGGIVDTTGGIPSTGLDEDTIYVHWDNGASSHIVSLLTVSQYGCSSPISFDTITEPPKMNPDYDVTDGTCGLANGIITLYTDTHELTFTWDTTFTNPTDTIQQGLLGGQTFTVLVHGESSSPDAPQGTICTDTISIYLPDTGYTTALFDTLINDVFATQNNGALIGDVFQSMAFIGDKGFLVANAAKKIEVVKHDDFTSKTLLPLQIINKGS